MCGREWLPGGGRLRPGCHLEEVEETCHLVEVEETCLLEERVFEEDVVGLVDVVREEVESGELGIVVLVVDSTLVGLEVEDSEV